MSRGEREIGYRYECKQNICWRLKRKKDQGESTDGARTVVGVKITAEGNKTL
jgi:hypothetical protein